MATNYLKPQEPLKKIDKDTGDINYLYPITTPDQIVMEDGSRLNAKLDEINTDIASAQSMADSAQTTANTANNTAKAAMPKSNFSFNASTATLNITL